MRSIPSWPVECGTGIGHKKAFNASHLGVRLTLENGLSARSDRRHFFAGCTSHTVMRIMNSAFSWVPFSLSRFDRQLVCAYVVAGASDG